VNEPRDNDPNVEPTDGADVPAAEIVAAMPRRLTDDGAGRVFDPKGRIERIEPARATVDGEFHVETGGNVGCSGPILRWAGRLLGIFALIAVGGAFLAASGLSLSDGIDWAREHPVRARVVFVAVVSAMIPLVIPTGPVAAIPGYLWGSFEGLFWVLVCAVIGGTFNMFVTRRFVRGRIDAFVAGNPALQAVRNAIDLRGFRIALALRLSPVVPFALLAYCAGLTRLSYMRFIVAAVIGGIPWTLVYAIAGSLLAEQQRAVTMNTDVGPMGPWLRVIGLAFTLAVAVWIGRVARREVAQVRRSASGNGNEA